MTKPWIQTIRRASGLIEHVCEHGVGHPTPDSVREMQKRTGQKYWDIHGCCGCCTKPEWIKAEKEK